jgi:hypothetical protein
MACFGFSDVSLSLPPVRHVQRQASLLSGMYLPDDFSSYAWRWTCLTGGRHNLVIHALKFSDMVARIKRALAASFGVPTPSLLVRQAYLVVADGIVLLLATCFRKSF